MTLPNGEEVRHRVEELIARHWTADISVRAWWALLAAERWSSPTLPEQAGGLGWPADLAGIVTATLTRSNVLGPPVGLGLTLAAPTIVRHGTAQQAAAWIPPILDGTAGWCQLFSEPQAGSDLAGLQTRAERDGDGWVITGQKVWTSTARTADLAILLARTDPDAPKHRGITFFVIAMDQPGIEVRPLREMTGRAVFNEVFLDGARVPDTAVIGELHGGWAVANTTLGFERAATAHGGATFSPALPGSRGGDLDRPAAGFVGRTGPISGAAVGRRHLRMLRELAGEQQRSHDPLVRQRLAGVQMDYELARLRAWRARTVPGSRSGFEGNVAKVANSGAVAAARDAANLLLGPEGQLWESTGSAGVFQEMTVFSPAPPIYAGSDQIQRTLLGERALGLPKEPGPAPDTPFRDLPKN